MRHAFDTNVLAYAAGVGEVEADRAKLAIAEALLTDVMEHDRLVLPVQVALELHHLLVRKSGFTRTDAAAVVRGYLESALLVATDPIVLEAAFDLAALHNLQIFDSVILAAAARGRCGVLYSEDMQHGFVWEGVTIVNPFA